MLLHEAGEDGAAMPSLESFVAAVKVACDNLAKVNIFHRLKIYSIELSMLKFLISVVQNAK